MRITLKVLFFSLITLFSVQAWSGFFDQKPTNGLNSQAGRFLPVEQAFRLTGKLSGTQVILNWDIEPGHYLYRSRFKARMVEPAELMTGSLQIPRGEQTEDEFLGVVEILRGQLQVILPLHTDAARLKRGVVLDIQFQGCAEAGLCYPPHNQQLSLVP